MIGFILTDIVRVRGVTQRPLEQTGLRAMPKGPAVTAQWFCRDLQLRNSPPFNQSATPATGAEVVSCQITVLLSPERAVSCRAAGVMVKRCFRSDFPQEMCAEWSLFKSAYANVPALPVSECSVTMAAAKAFLPSCDCQMKDV